MSDWSSDVCSSDRRLHERTQQPQSAADVRQWRRQLQRLQALEFGMSGRDTWIVVLEIRVEPVRGRLAKVAKAGGIATQQCHARAFELERQYLHHQGLLFGAEQSR